MAIQLPNAGLGDGQTGDNEFVMWTKVKDNFSNTSHAASKLVGTNNGNLVAYENIPAASLRRPLGSYDRIASGDFNSLTTEGIYYVANNLQNSPDVQLGVTGFHWYVDVYKLLDGTFQRATGHSSGEVYVRSMSGSGVWVTWKSIGEVTKTYKITTATAANVTVSADGSLMRASSSLKYKDVIKELELDSDLYNKAMDINPIVYRSKSEVDPKDWHYMSFIAEELGELDPSLTQWLVKTHDNEGNELDEPVKEAEGINLNAICAVLHATNIYQDKKLKELEQRLIALESNNEPIE